MESHSPRWSALIQRFQKDRSLHSTLLVTGLEGVGKKSITLHFIQTLFCDQSVFSGGSRLTPCDECRSCKRALAGQWMDLYWFEPESQDEDRLGTHKIETFRELKTKLGRGATEEPYQVVVITEADRMTAPAANSILKMLEEPPPGWIFILTAVDSSRLLPTILSRCLEIRLQPLNAQQILTVLKESRGIDLPLQRAEIAARAGQGSIKRAELFLEDEIWKLRDQLLGLLSHPAQDWSKFLESISMSQRAMINGLDLIESLFYDLLMSRISPEHPWIHFDQKPFLEQWANAKNIPHSGIQNILDRVAENRRLATLTLNSKLLAQQTLQPLLQQILTSR